MFGFFSFMTDFLHRVSGMSFDGASMSFDGASAVLLGYGAANIAGNLLAGRFYSERSGRWKAVLPAALGAGYLLLFAAGNAAFAAGAVILLLGVLAGFASVAGQSMITSAAPEAPDFANGLFLTAANFGTMAGTAFCGLFITLAGTRFSLRRNAPLPPRRGLCSPFSRPHCIARSFRTDVTEKSPFPIRKGSF